MANAAVPVPSPSETAQQGPLGVAKPLRDFMQTETASAGLLVLMTVIAMAWANSMWSDSYESLWATEIVVDVVGQYTLSMDFEHWINDGAMAVFFFVIGLELRHEISVGDFRQKRRLIIPALGGLGGLVVPAILYLLINPSGDEARGWGVVIGTDTAFLLGALALVGPKASSQLRVFLLTMTIADDLMAVAVIGIVYSDTIELLPLTIAGVALAAIVAFGYMGFTNVALFTVVGGVAWLGTLESGLHPSIIGMLCGIAVVSYVPRRAALDNVTATFNAFRQSPLPVTSKKLSRGLREVVSVNERLQQMLHPWTSYAIVPLFALANAGVDLRGGVLEEALRSAVFWGVVAGLVAGKPLGIALLAFGGGRLGLGPMPRGLGPGQIIAGGALSGMGFSVSILIVNLAFDSPELKQQATAGVLLACVLSVLTGWIVFRVARLLGEAEGVPEVLDSDVDPVRDHIRGPVDAPLTLVEYGDYECPFCSAATQSIDQLRRRFGDELRYVYRHLPLPDVHPNSEMAAEAAEEAGKQGKFWEMHEMLFQHQDALQIEDLVGYASRLDLDVEEFARALTEGRHREHVRRDAIGGDASGARGTPTFFVNGRRHKGPWDTASLTAALEASRRRGEVGANATNT